MLRQTRYIKKGFERFYQRKSWLSKILVHATQAIVQFLEELFLTANNQKCLASHTLPLSSVVCYFLIKAADSLHRNDGWCLLHGFVRSKVRVNISSSPQEKCGNCYHSLHGKSHLPGIREEAPTSRESDHIKLEHCSYWGNILWDLLLNHFQDLNQW